MVRVKLNICNAHLYKLINRPNAHHITLYIRYFQGLLMLVLFQQDLFSGIIPLLSTVFLNLLIFVYIMSHVMFSGSSLSHYLWELVLILFLVVGLFFFNKLVHFSQKIKNACM